MSNKLDFNFTNAITVNRPYRKPSRIIPRLLVAALVLVGISTFVVVKWDPAQSFLYEKPQPVYNPLYDEH
jgi:hypothetical protein